MRVTTARPLPAVTVPPALHRVALAALACAVLLTGFAGRAGVQVVDRALATRIFATHLHGVLGEAEWVEEYGTPAPFVPTHCHNDVVYRDGQPGPESVQAAQSLAGAAHCADVAVLPAPLPELAGGPMAALPAVQTRFYRPPVPPPQQ